MSVARGDGVVLRAMSARDEATARAAHCELAAEGFGGRGRGREAETALLDRHAPLI